MKLFVLFIPALIYSADAFSQSAKENSSKKRLQYFSLAATNSHTALPFGRFSALFCKEFHPGVEIGTGINWKEKKKHDWFQTLKAGYSYHRFVQHTFMIYTEAGYRYKFSGGFAANVRLGGGWLCRRKIQKCFC